MWPIGAALSREVAKKMSLMLQQYKQVTDLVELFVFFSPV